ncbi:hypothetical protein ROHU_024472 [Labeo rohita]|uniref:Uncharacterized protein n=1 Tax=Labeo rohita TaxID=84645 RepID=A0A498MRE3_LABRO|nr:hypothetical protein ROHU_024472 [Labeo rohita]
MGGEFSISKLLTDDTCHVLKCAGDESSKEVTDFGTDSFLACHSRHQQNRRWNRTGRSGTRRASGQLSVGRDLWGLSVRRMSGSPVLPAVQPP